MRSSAPPLPRKTARQSRSRMTVEALLEATARVLVQEGYERTSTNRIAAVAGVSIGSLYQYFPNKEALVAALIARHNRQMLDLLERGLEEVAALDLEAGIRRLVAAMVDAHRVDRALHRVFDEQVPRMGQMPEVEEVERRIFALVRAYLEARRDRIAVRDLDTAAFVCVTAVEAVTHRAVTGDGPAADGAALEEEIVRLVLGYLQPGTAPAERRRPARRRH